MFKGDQSRIMRIELIFVPSSRAVSVPMCVYNGTVYIYSRISGEKKAKGRRGSMFSARHNIVGFFMCTHSERGGERETGEKRAIG